MTAPPRRLGIRAQFLVSYLVVAVVGGVTVFAAVGLVAPGAFEAAMGGMGDMMAAVHSAFEGAVWSALIVATAAALLAVALVGVAFSARLSGPISRLAIAGRRISEGRYAERVAATSADEIGELAGSFNRLAESLELTERRRLELVGDVAHELRTPLAILDGYLEGLQDGVIKPIEPTWRLLRDETARLSHLVNDLQELWRAEARQLPPSLSSLDVAEELRAVRERFAAQAREHGVELRLVGPGEAASVQADRERLAQILDNFASNAIRHSPAGAPVTLTAAVDEHVVTIGVVDQGPGLTQEQRERVFERFYRVDPSRSRALGGAGIGLAIAKALATTMGGRTWAESDGPGRGSTFRLALPRSG
jgi:two-component system sensor histidine kinase BaeS